MNIVNMRLPAICSGFITFFILSGSEGVNIDKPHEKNIIKQLLHELQDLRDNYADLKHRQDKAEKDKVLQGKKLNYLSRELQDLKTRHDDLEKQQTQTTRELQDMQNKYSELKHDHDKTVSELQEMRNKYNKPLRHQDKTSAARMNFQTNTKRQNMEQTKLPVNVNFKPVEANGNVKQRSQEKRGMSEESRIGFTARLSHSLTNMARSQTIKFDNVLTNTDNGYNPLTGIYTCTYSGMYVFFSNIVSYPGKRVESEIVHNSNVIASMYSHDSDQFGSGSNMAVIQMNTGDEVWVRVHGDYHDSGTEINGNTFSSFSGFRIEEGTVGFTARLSDSLSNLGTFQTIKFNSVVTNIGNGYSNNTGVFTCPYSGMYIFFSSILAYPGKWMETEIVRNSNNIAHMYSADSHYFGDGCNMVVVNMNKGDEVLVRVHGNHHSSGTEIDGNYFSSFSGFRVF